MSQRLNVMHLVYGLDAAGMENGVINICNLLPSDQFAPSICTLTPKGAAQNRVDKDRVEVNHVPRHCRNDPTFPIRLAWLMRRQRINILHTHNWATMIEGLVAARLAGVSMVVHGEHGKLQDFRRRIFTQRWGWRAVDQVLSVSGALADRMTHVVGFPRYRIQVIPNGVDTERFRPLDSTKSELRRQLGLPPSGLLIGMVARFVRFKDHAGVIRAVAMLRGRGTQTHLAFAGSGPLRGELEQLASALGVSDCVHFLGEMPRVERLLHALDVFVSNSSHNEGMSNAILEALACAIPVVATRVAASPELLDEGSAGLLISPRDPDALATALRQLVDKPELRKLLSQAGRQRIEDRYGIGSMVESYGRLYLRLAGGRKMDPDNESTSVPVEASNE